MGREGFLRYNFLKLVLSPGVSWFFEFASPSCPQSSFSSPGLPGFHNSSSLFSEGAFGSPLPCLGVGVDLVALIASRTARPATAVVAASAQSPVVSTKTVRATFAGALPASAVVVGSGPFLSSAPSPTPGSGEVAVLQASLDFEVIPWSASGGGLVDLTSTAGVSFALPEVAEAGVADMSSGAEVRHAPIPASSHSTGSVPRNRLRIVGMTSAAESDVESLQPSLLSWLPNPFTVNPPEDEMTSPEPTPEMQAEERDEVFVNLFHHMRDNLGINPQEDGASPAGVKAVDATCANGTRVRVTVQLAEE